MEPTAISLVISAVFTGVAGVIIALATFRKAAGNHTKAHSLLARLWDWVQIRGLEDQVPAGLRHMIEQALDEQPPPEEGSSP